MFLSDPCQVFTNTFSERQGQEKYQNGQNLFVLDQTPYTQGISCHILSFQSIFHSYKRFTNEKLTIHLYKDWGAYAPSPRSSLDLDLKCLYSFFFENGVICFSIIVTLCFTSTYMKAVFRNTGIISLFRKNCHFQHELTYVEKPIGPI